MDFQAHNWRMVKRFIWLQRIAPEYAEAAINAYAKDPASLNPWIREDIKAEQARRQSLSSSPASQSK
jgi:predicted HicB family RNase H-like nuclease